MPEKKISYPLNVLSNRLTVDNWQQTQQMLLQDHPLGRRRHWLKNKRKIHHLIPLTGISI